MKGFTIIEIVISIAIAATLTAIAVGSFRTAQIKKEQQGIVHSLLADLDKQKSFTQAGKEGSVFGIKINASDWILYKGSTYATTSASQTITVDSKFQITETLSNSQNVIYFSKLTGSANETATITVSHIEGKVSPLLLTVDASGAISVIE